MYNNLSSLTFLSNFIRSLTILFIFNLDFNFLLIIFLTIQNNFTKDNLLDIYSSGLFFDFNETRKVSKLLTIFLVIFFFLLY